MSTTLDDNELGLVLPLPAMGLKEDITEEGADIVDASLIFLGCDNAGKSTIMQLLANDRLVVQQPTLHPSSLEFVVDKVRYKAFDLAGHETGRRLWKEYFTFTSAVFFLVDAADHSRFAEAAEELGYLLSTPELKATPIAVLGMKTDLEGAASEDEFRNAMGLSQEAVSENVVKLFMCSVLAEEGCLRVGDAIHWLSAQVREHRSNTPSTVQAATLIGALADNSCGDDGNDDYDMMV